MMKKGLGGLFIGGALLIAATFIFGAAPQGTLTFTVSMERPNTHYYHVVFKGEGLKGGTQDFKMPVWTPGFYQVMNYSRNVLNFRAEDGAGNPLAWEKTAKNIWRVKSGRSSSITVSYDVYAFTRFVAHEYFHLYNVKRIRPLALGPFDYDKENYTRMLWVSEEFTSYYEDLILRRAGLITRDDVFEAARSNIANYENIPGHRFQSAAESSFDTWLHSFGRGDNAANTTISCYDKGAALGMLLDFKIRAETKNKSSLDEVMRALYQEYYKEKKRGFTDGEFRAVCERIAGCPLAEIFDVYVSTTQDIDYASYIRSEFPVFPGYSGPSDFPSQR